MRVTFIVILKGLSKIHYIYLLYKLLQEKY
jgi:hypothetical protein